MVDKKPSIIDRLREFVDSLGADESEPESAEADAVETEADAIETEADDIETDEAEAEAIENADGEDETPGTSDEGSAEDGDLRATIREQAAMIETYRNTIAELGGTDPMVAEADEAADLDESDTAEDDAIEAFDEDYDARKALLAELTQGEAQ